MKKTLLFFAAAIFAIAAVSCNRIEQVPETGDVTVTPQRIPVTITATVQEDTKTTYAGGTTFSWTTGDKISVLTYNSSADTYKYEEFTASSTGASSSFTGSMDPGFALSSYALYPASDDHDYDPNDWAAIHFNIPKSKDCSSVATAELPMVATRTGDVFSFSHCSGAAKIVVDNIPEKYTSVTISFSSKSDGGVKISGTFGIHDGGSGVFGWSSAYAEDANDRVFSRKVPVNSHSATLYIPFATGGTIYNGNTVTVTGHDGVSDKVLYTNSSVGTIGAFARATVIPLKPLVMNGLDDVNWSSGSVVTSTLDSWSTKLALTEMKLYADQYYLYARVKGPSASLEGSNYLDIFLTDGNDAGTAERSGYWCTKGSTWYNKEHKGTVTTSPASLSMTFNSKSITTKAETSGDDILWYMAIPRADHSLLTSGTVYVSFAMWHNWDFIGCIPSAIEYGHTDASMQAFVLP